MKKAQPQPEDKYVLRLPDGLRDRIKSAAQKKHRSMNAEIVWTLENAYPDASERVADAIRTLETELQKAPEEKRADLRRSLETLKDSIFN